MNIRVRARDLLSLQPSKAPTSLGEKKLPTRPCATCPHLLPALPSSHSLPSSHAASLTASSSLRTLHMLFPLPGTHSSPSQPHGSFLRSQFKCHLLRRLSLVSFFIYFIFWCLRVACGILVPPQGIEPAPPALEPWSLNHCTSKKVPWPDYLRALPYSALVCDI